MSGPTDRITAQSLGAACLQLRQHTPSHRATIPRHGLGAALGLAMIRIAHARFACPIKDRPFHV